LEVAVEKSLDTPRSVSLTTCEEVKRIFSGLRSLEKYGHQKERRKLTCELYSCGGGIGDHIKLAYSMIK
jgi:hypothetical protein